ncbi:CD109 antigen-like [Argiope bruennichi]|uniref:CD109 antigen like protein n=1 Tax=Argiope bruennichi TaxID=94029 RepID=A0A8T0F838_ARGBR|nr:CD109 antigen-like [Argiope bruennichi]KAF8787021.1 CD109 antigen like protein [Argiope bruennichi]
MLLKIFTLLLASVFSVSGQFQDTYPQFASDLRRHHLKHEPTYFVMASKMVRPGQVYRVYVNVYQTMFPITVRASIQRDGVELATALQEVKQNIPETLLLKVPTSSVPGEYNLRVEGNVNGVLGGTAFINETKLTFSQRSMTIFVQTDKPVYKQGQIVRFRALPITTGLKAFPDAVDLYMLDPRRTIVKRWLSRQTNLGAVSLEYPLSQQPVYGKWTLQVVAQGQIEEHNFLVEEYYQTRFEVNVTMPTFFTDKEPYVYGTIQANYTSGVPVKGNLTVIASIEPHRMNNRVPASKIEKFYAIFDGTVDFKFPMSDFAALVNNLDKSKVAITAYVGERYLDIMEKGFSEALIFNSGIKVEFLGDSPQIFKPGMPFRVFVSVFYRDGSRIPIEHLSRQKLQIIPIVEFYNGGTRRLNTRHEKMSLLHPGIWEIAIDLQAEFLSKDDIKDIRMMTLEAYYFDDYTSEQAKALLKVYGSFSETNRHLQVTTSTRTPRVGEYIIFHVRANYYVETFSYVLVSKGIILLAGQETMSSSIKTFAVSLSPEMAPTSTIVVYSVAREGEVVVDSLTFPVDGISRNNFTVTLNNKKDKTGDTIEVVVVGRPSSYVGIAALDKALYDMKGGNEFSHAEVLRKMSLFDEGTNGTLTHIWMSKEGNLEDVVHYPAATYGVDAASTLDFAGLIVFTDANVTRRPDYCNETLGYFTCLDGKCYRYEKQCDGFKDCSDGMDEAGCPEYDDLRLKHFKMNRINRIQRLYDNSWLWHDINIGPLGYYIFNVPVPEIPTRWMVQAFGMNTIDGFGIQDKSIEFSSVRPFYMNVEMPTKSMQGEQIGIRISVFNYMFYEIEALIVVANSPDYKFVHVESFGRVESYNPRTSFGEHQHLVFIKPGKAVEVYMPIVPTRLGDIEVNIMTKSQVAKHVVTRKLHVEADGIPQYRHTTVQLDLSQGAYLIKYLDTNITESPIVPYRQERLYMFGSNRAQVSVVGDVVGPAFATMPVNASTLLRKPSWCGEQNMYNFAANLYTLLYLRLTGQRQSEIEKQAFRHLNIGYQRQLSYQLDDGSFVPFRYKSRPSVWLTAFCARIFHKATFQEWENFLFIDPKVIVRAARWLLEHQTPDGSFYETSQEPLDRKMDQSVVSPYGNVQYRNISLTAHVLITLSELKDLQGDVGSKLSTARHQAQRYLERMLHIVKELPDPYELAIVTYALTISNSPDANEALNILDSRMREESGMRYWARERVKGATVKIENTRPYMISRLPDKYDASNIEATAYGLLVHVERNAVIQREIVEWLNSQRLTYGGWASTQDSIIALQALIEHAIQSRVRDVIDVSLTIEIPAVPGFIKHIHIGEDNLSKQQSFEIDNAWGVVLVRAQGSGIALVQLSVQYNVDYPHLQTQPPVQAFDLKVKGYYYGRNSSHIEISTCQRWTFSEESDKSGMAVVEVDIPTGYVIEQQKLDAYVHSGRVRNLREARFHERKVAFYFNYLDQENTCLSFTIQRWYPVANMTRWLPVRVYDYYAPERFNETMFDVYNLFVLSICQVCGSYQCPYCPIFSWSNNIVASPILLITSICALFLLSRKITFHN